MTKRKGVKWAQMQTFMAAVAQSLVEEISGGSVPGSYQNPHFDGDALVFPAQNDAHFDGDALVLTS